MVIELKNIVIGTAGHIDHGKTTVVQKITGIDTDVLPEEKKRGITINIGFSYLKKSDGRKIGIIDVPGHEKFIKNMVAGANGIQYLLMIIACDDGIMQQTKEHFNICQLLGIRRGMIVLTKSDICSKERVEDVKKEVVEYFKGTFLEAAPICVTSLKDEKSYENLKNILFENISKIERENIVAKSFRLSIDRVFPVKGFGVVITGTSLNNAISVGDMLMLYPQQKKVRVKRIENHGEEVEKLEAGNRCALNLTGVEISEVKRGDILSKNFDLKRSKLIDGYFTLLKSCKKLKNNSQIRIDIGTKEVIARIKIFEKNELMAGESAFVQLELNEDVIVIENDLGIIRSISPVMTIGGFRVLNIEAEKVKRTNKEYIDKLKVIYKGNDIEQIKLYLKEKKEKMIFFEEIEREFEGVEKEKLAIDEILEVKGTYIFRENLEKIIENIKKIFDEFYYENSLKQYMSKAELKNRVLKNMTAKEYNILLEYLKEREFIDVIEDKICLKNHQIKLSKEQKKIKDDILVTLKQCGFDIRKKKEIIKKEDEEVFMFLVEKGLIIYLGDDYYILSGFFKEGVKLLTEYLKRNKKIRLAEFRDLIKGSRKVALMLLDKMDAERITEKKDDYRVLRG